eukprot:993262_1
MHQTKPNTPSFNPPNQTKMARHVQPHDAPSFSNEFSSNSFVTLHGGIESEEHVIVIQVQMQMLEQAGRGLQQENYDLRKQMELDQTKIQIQKKTESIKLDKNKT